MKNLMLILFVLSCFFGFVVAKDAPWVQHDTIALDGGPTDWDDLSSLARVPATGPGDLVSAIESVSEDGDSSAHSVAHE